MVREVAGFLAIKVELVSVCQAFFFVLSFVTLGMFWAGRTTMLFLALSPSLTRAARKIYGVRSVYIRKIGKILKAGSFVGPCIFPLDILQKSCAVKWNMVHTSNLEKILCTWYFFFSMWECWGYFSKRSVKLKPLFFCFKVSPSEHVTRKICWITVRFKP